MATPGIKHNFTADNIPANWDSETLFPLFAAMSVLLSYPELPRELLETLLASARARSGADAAAAAVFARWLESILGAAAAAPGAAAAAPGAAAPYVGSVDADAAVALPYSQEVLARFAAAAAAAPAAYIPDLLKNVQERAIEPFPGVFRYPDPEAFQLMAQLYAAVRAAVQAAGAEPAVGATPIGSAAAAAVSSPLAEARALLARAGMMH